MSEDVPPYLPREFVCEVCGDPVKLSQKEAEALAALEREFPSLAGKPGAVLCERCRQRESLRQ